ncbi:MAG: ABC transporter ATP-binding protein [Ottowia sp.]|nr:ABC transporter ATP-binding protein [Ottowia sp.]
MAVPAAIELRGITKTYKLGSHIVKALQGVDLAVSRGELVALTGPSGSGKSTILNICGLLDQPDDGTLLLEGKPVAGMSARDLTLLRRDRLGFIFQRFNLVPVMTAHENVDFPLMLESLPAAQRQERVRGMLAAVGLTEHAGHRPDRLSGGQQQRVAIARALIKQPSVVVADEPTASLDSRTADQVVDLMREHCHAQGAAFLIATHDERLTSRCDRVVRMLDGVIQ